MLAEVEVRGRSVPGRVMSVHQGMRVTRAWKFSRQDWLDLAIYTAELVLPIFESRFPDDNRPRTAIESGSAAAAARTDVHDNIEAWLRERISMMESLW